jgi:hypothetical protein
MSSLVLEVPARLFAETLASSNGFEAAGAGAVEFRELRSESVALRDAMTAGLVKI